MPLIGPIDPAFAGVTGQVAANLNNLRGFAMGGGYTDGGGVSNADGGGLLDGLVGVAQSYGAGTVDTGGGTGSGGSGSTGNGDYVGRSGNQLRGLVGESYGSSGPLPGFPPGDGTDYCICAGKLNDPSAGIYGLTGYSESGLFEPQFCIVAGTLQKVTGFSISLAGMVGTTEGKLGQLHGNSGNITGAEVHSGGENPATGEGGGSGGVNGTGNGDWAGRIGGELRGLVGVAFDSSAIVANFSLLQLQTRYGFFAFGHKDTGPGGVDLTYGFQGELSGYGFAGYTGGRAKKTLPAPTLNASGTTTILGEFQTELSGYEFTASGTVTGLGTFRGAYKKNHYAVTGYSGGRAVVAPDGSYGISARGIAQRLGGASGTLPHPSLTASGTVGVTGGAHGVLGGLRAGVSGVFIGTYGGYTLNATGGAVVEVAYEAYSITLLPTEDGLNTATTHYTNFPFDRIVRFGSKHYGVATDGLYELGGDTFDGDPIVAEIETAQSDFEAKSLKRPVGLYVQGTLGEDLVVSVKTDDTIVNGRSFAARVQHGAAARRVKFGLGTTGHQLAFQFTNTGGEDFEIEEFAPEVEVLRRLI